MNIKRVLWWLVPDIEDALRRFPVTALLGLVGTGFMLAFADANLLGPVRNAYASPAPAARVYFALLVAIVLSSLIIESVGETKRWSRALTAGLALGVAVLLAGLQHLPLIVPELAAQWLPFNFGWVGNGVILLAVAASAQGTSGETANIRILVTVLAAFGALLAAWVIVSIVAFGLGGVRGALFAGSLAPTAQVFMYALALFLWLSWLANLPTPEEGRTHHGALIAETQFVRRIIVPLMIVIIIGLATVTLRQFIQGDARTVVRGVPMIVGPAALVLFLTTMAWLYARPSAIDGAAETGPLVSGFAAAAPFVMIVVVAVCGYGFWREWTAAHAVDPALAVHLQPFGPHHIANTLERWVLSGTVVVIALTALVWPAVRDFRLPFWLGGVAFLLMGFGPWSLDRLTTRATAAEFDRVLASAGLKPNGVLVPKVGAATISVEAHTKLVQGLRRLLNVDGLGALAPVFAGAADSPFAAPATNPNQLANAVLTRLELEPNFGRAPAIARPVTAHRQLAIQGSREMTKGATLTLAGFDSMSGPISASMFSPNRQAQPIRLDGKAPEARHDGALASAEVVSEFEARFATGGKLVLVRRASGVALEFDLAPMLGKILAHEEVRHEIGERNRLRRQNQPRQTVRDELVPPPLADPETIEALGAIKARLVIERLHGNAHDGNIIINDLTGWLLHNRADIEKRP